MPVIQVKPWGEGQGDFVEINDFDFIEGSHELYVPKKLSAKELKAQEAASLAEEQLDKPE
ncbi:hypothetical protein [Pseudomonas moorei]|uniref:Uncharacterized protein n=1 Tax=Pseudomonas moorei TaxID=395599 RepID=A0A1H1FI54_9PSED|nr:hypothetical protein [Pseudomonas moorei]KAB0509679.1 hypothetical protein F7R06_01260 [Pseudomonas moorei]SDR00631.1 hypothetical protein SAMN04490195_2719 [Pseudomonas moorei]